MVAVFHPDIEFPAPNRSLLPNEARSIVYAFTKPIPFIHSGTNPFPRKDTQYVHMVPGTAAPGFSLNWLRNRLANKGIFAETWGGFRVNAGPTIWAIPREVNAIRDMCKKANGPITYVGHSLGGLYGLFLARSLTSGHIKHTISLGSPCELTAESASTSTNVGIAIRFMEAAKPFYQGRLIDHWRAERELVPLEDGIQRTSIIAIKDGIVNSLACELPDQPGCHNFYVDANHCDLITDATVAELVSFLVKNGNQVDLPEELRKKLSNREDIFKYKPDEKVNLPEGAPIIELANPQSTIDEFIDKPNGIEIARRLVSSPAQPLFNVISGRALFAHLSAPASPNGKPTMAPETSRESVLSR